MKTIITNILLLLILVFYSKSQSICDEPDACDKVVWDIYPLMENSVAVNPNSQFQNIVLTASIADKSGSRIVACVSTDWGFSWNEGVLLENSYGDPATAIDLDGRMYVGYVDGGRNEWAAFSIDNGINWERRQVTFNIITDKMHLWVDNSETSQYRGRLYCSWSEPSSNTSVACSYSTDQGLSWIPSQSYPIYTGGTSLWGVNIQTDADGYVYIMWPVRNTGGIINAIGLARSTDGGVSFDFLNENIYEGINISTGNNGGASMTCNMKKDSPAFGWLYAVWPQTQSSPSDADIYLMYSTDKGETWTGNPVNNYPITVNRQTTNNQFIPRISCDPESGYLACIYRDSRTDPFLFHTYVSFSTNYGMNWCDKRVSDNDNVGVSCTDGEYIGLTYIHGHIYPCWSACVNGTRVRTYFSPVPSDLIVYPPITKTFYYATGSIMTSGDFSISQPIYTTFEAGYSIDLNDGFMADLGSDFTANITDCGLDNGDDYFSNGTMKEADKKKSNINPYEFKLLQNYPNPFNPETRIDYSLKINTHVKLIVYDILGKVVKTLVNEYKPAGVNSIMWDGTSNNGLTVASGVYIYKIEAGSFEDTKKMLLIR